MFISFYGFLRSAFFESGHKAELDLNIGNQ